MMASIEKNRETPARIESLMRRAQANNARIPRQKRTMSRHPIGVFMFTVETSVIERSSKDRYACFDLLMRAARRANLKTRHESGASHRYDDAISPPPSARQQPGSQPKPRILWRSL